MPIDQIGGGIRFLKQKNKGENVEELIKTLSELGYKTMMGLLRAKRDGIITSDEYYSIKEYVHTVRGIPRDWYKVFVWNNPCYN